MNLENVSKSTVPARQKLFSHTLSRRAWYESRFIAPTRPMYMLLCIYIYMLLCVYIYICDVYHYYHHYYYQYYHYYSITYNDNYNYTAPAASCQQAMGRSMLHGSVLAMSRSQCERSTTMGHPWSSPISKRLLCVSCSFVYNCVYAYWLINVFALSQESCTKGATQWRSSRVARQQHSIQSIIL